MKRSLNLSTDKRTSRPGHSRSAGARAAGAWIAVLALAFFAASPLAAQSADAAPPEWPFWVTLEVGAAPANEVCADCGENGWGWGSAGSVALGFTVEKRLRLGVLISVWSDRGDPFTERQVHILRTHLMLVGSYFPWRRFPLFIRGGGGLTAYNARDVYKYPLKGTDGRDLGSLVHTDGLGWLLGAGYEVRLLKRFALVPSVSYFYSRQGSLTFDTTHLLADRVTLRLFELNLGFLYHVND